MVSFGTLLLAACRRSTLFVPISFVESIENPKDNTVQQA